MSKHVAIVGGGVIGLFCAVRLAQSGARVTLLEAEQEDFSVHGPAASLAAAGMLAPITEALTEAPDSAEHTELALASFDLWRKLSVDALWSDGVRFDGAAIVARDAEVLARKTAALGRKAEMLNAVQFRKCTGIDVNIESALFVEDEAVADPPRVLSGLVMEARRYGVKTMFSHDVECVETAPLLVRSFEGAAIEADVVVLAPGPWATGRLIETAPALRHVRPAKGHLAPVALSQELRASIRAPDFYLARRGERDVVLGSTMEPGRYDRGVNRARVQEMFDAAEKLLPGVARPHEEARPWAGIRPMSPDGAPMIGPSGEVLVACGHSRNGWLLAPITAAIVCAYVHGEEISPLWAALNPDRFEKTA